MFHKCWQVRGHFWASVRLHALTGQGKSAGSKMFWNIGGTVVCVQLSSFSQCSRRVSTETIPQNKTATRASFPSPCVPHGCGTATGTKRTKGHRRPTADDTTTRPKRFLKTWKYCKTHKNNPSPEKHEAWEQNRLQQQHSLYDWIIAIMSPSGTQLNALWRPRHLSIRRNNMQMSGQWLMPYFNLSSAIKSHT